MNAKVDARGLLPGVYQAQPRVPVGVGDSAVADGTDDISGFAPDNNSYRESELEAGDALSPMRSQDRRSMADGVGRTVAGGRLGPGVVSPGMGLGAPERGRGWAPARA